MNRIHAKRLQTISNKDVRLRRLCLAISLFTTVLAWLKVMKRPIKIRIPETQTQSLRCIQNIEKSDCLSVCLSVHPSTHMKHLGSLWMDFHEVWYFKIFQISVKRSRVWLKSDKNIWYTVQEQLWTLYYTWRAVNIYDNILLNSSQNEKHFRQKLYRK